MDEESLTNIQKIVSLLQDRKRDDTNQAPLPLGWIVDGVLLLLSVPASADIHCLLRALEIVHHLLDLSSLKEREEVDILLVHTLIPLLSSLTELRSYQHFRVRICIS
jgi:hypothetical protein